MKRIGVIGAMEEEIEILKQRMDAEEKSGWHLWIFIVALIWRQGGCDCQKWYRKVNAAVCTQILADIFEVDMIINTGVAGSLDAAINIGDIVLSVDALQHDVDATVFGYEPGVIPRMQSSVFQADGHLVELAREICSKSEP